MLESFFHGATAPFICPSPATVTAPLDLFSELDQSFRGIRPTIQQYVLDVLQQFPVNFLVDFQLLRIDDAHVQPRLYRVIQEGCVHRFPDNFIAAE